MRYVRWSLLPILSIISLPVLFGQGKNGFPIKRCPVKTINFEQGLLNNTSSDVIADRLGFTWSSAKTGLQRYNGYVLETIVPVAGKDTFNINYPVFFCGLHDGNFWMSCKQGVLEYDPAANSFKNVIAIHSGQYSVPFPVIPIRETKDGIWCLQQGSGIVIYDRK